MFKNCSTSTQDPTPKHRNQLQIQKSQLFVPRCPTALNLIFISGYQPGKGPERNPWEMAATSDCCCMPIYPEGRCISGQVCETLSHHTKVLEGQAGSFPHLPPQRLSNKHLRTDFSWERVLARAVRAKATVRSSVLCSLDDCVKHFF